MSVQAGAQLVAPARGLAQPEIRTQTHLFVLRLPYLAGAEQRTARGFRVIVALPARHSRAQAEPRAFAQIQIQVPEKVQLLEPILGHPARLFFPLHRGKIIAAGEAVREGCRCPERRPVPRFDLSASDGFVTLAPLRHQVDHAGQSRGAPVEGHRTAGNLDALDADQGQALKVDRSTERVGAVVERHPVQEHEGKIRISPPYLSRRQATA